MLHAGRDALHAEVARGAGEGRSGEATARDSTSSPAVPTSGLTTQPDIVTFLSRPILTQPKPPKFDNIEADFGMWRSNFQACWSSIGCPYVLKATDNPVVVGDINVSQEDLEQRRTPKQIFDARVVYGLLMNSMTVCHCRIPRAASRIAKWCIAGAIEILHAENPSRKPQAEERNRSNTHGGGRELPCFPR